MEIWVLAIIFCNLASGQQRPSLGIVYKLFFDLNILMYKVSGEAHGKTVKPMDSETKVDEQTNP